MKKTFLLILFSLFFADTFAQVSSDSLAYQAQRKKINNMLAQRKQKFGQYDQSLSRHTGIFGLQTKKDIRASNDILMDIVKTDNDIFVQLKVLLDYRTFQQNQAMSHSSEIDSTNLGFMNSINKLRAENEKLKQDAATAEAERQQSGQRSMFIIIGLLVAVLYLLRLKFVKKTA
jgi:hypothetical protein